MADGDDEVAALQSRIEEIKADNAEVVSSMQTAEKDKIKQLALENDSKYSELESSSEARFNELKKTSDATIAKLTQEHEDDQAQLKKQSEAGSALSNDKMDSLQKECEATVAEMQAKIDEANEEETKTRLAMEEIANGISEAAKRGPAMLRSARDSLEKKQTRITDLEGQLTKLANEHKIYKNFYDGLDDTNKALDDERSTTETLRGEVAELEVTINTLENEKTNLAKDLAQAETAQAAADAERAATAEKFGTATEEAEKELKLRDVTVAEREDKITSLEQELSDLKEVADKANSEYSANISSSRNELSEQVATQTARAVKAEAEIVKLNTQLTEQGTRLDKEIAQKTATIRQLEQVRDELQVVVDEKHRGSNEIEEEHNKQVAKVESFKIKVDALEAELTAIKAQKEAVSGDLVAERTDLSSQINVLQNEKENLAATVERRDEEIDASNAAAADAREAANEAATELSALKIEYESIGTERDAITKQLDTVTESFNKQIEEVTGHFQSDREAAGASQEEKIQQLILSAKNSEENNQKQLGTMSESRAKIEKQNAELQQEMTLQQRKTKESNDNIIALKADLVKMNQVLAKNVKQFGQLAQDLETAGKVNDQLQKDLEQQKVDWNEEMKSIVQQRENLTVKIHELEDRVSEEVQKVADTREEGRSAIDNAEASALETKQREQKIEELEQQVSQMEAARDEAEELRTELREQHQSDIDASQEEKQNLDAKLSQVTQDLSECNATLDSTRAELIQARKDFSEEKVVRIALEGDATNGLLREKQLRETVEDKDRIIERMSSDHGDHHETGSGELIASQKVNLQLQQELKDAHEKNERNTMDISSWKAREGVARARADEGWAKADSEQARAGNIEEERQTLAAQLLEAQSMWKAEVAGKDDEIAGVMEKDTLLMKDLDDVRAQMEAESARRLESENAMQHAESSFADAVDNFRATEGRRAQMEEDYAENSAELAALQAEHEKLQQLSTEQSLNMQANIENLTDELNQTKSDLLQMTTDKTESDQNAASEAAAREAAETSQAEAERHRDEVLETLEETKTDFAAATAANDAAAKSAAAEIADLTDDHDTLHTRHGSAGTDIEELQKSKSDLTEQLAAATNDLNNSMDAQKELENWKADAIAASEAAAQQLADTMEQLARDMATCKAEQANAEGAMEVMNTKLEETKAALLAAQAEAKSAAQNKQNSIEELKIEQADGAAKAQKIEQLQQELSAANDATTAAEAAKAEARTQATDFNDEVGLLRSQLGSERKKAEVAATTLAECEAKLASMQGLNAENEVIMAQQLAAFAGAQSANKELKDAVNKLMDLNRKAEAGAKTAQDAVKSGKAAAPVMSSLRQEVAELSEAVIGASDSFDPNGGVFEAVDLKSAIEGGKMGAMVAAPPGGATARAVAPVAAAGGGSAAAARAAPSSSGGGYKSLEGTLEKEGGGKGKGKSYKKRHFRLGKTTLTYAASSKGNAKVLGVIQLAGCQVATSGADLTITDNQGREYELRAKSVQESSSWASAIEINTELAGNEEDDE